MCGGWVGGGGGGGGVCGGMGVCGGVGVGWGGVGGCVCVCGGGGGGGLSLQKASNAESVFSVNLRNLLAQSLTGSLTHCCLATPFRNMVLGQHWFM